MQIQKRGILNSIRVPLFFVYTSGQNQRGIQKKNYFINNLN